MAMKKYDVIFLFFFFLVINSYSAGCSNVYRVNTTVGNQSSISGASIGVLGDFFSTKKDIVDTNTTYECVYNNSFVYRTYRYIYLGRVQPLTYFRSGQVMINPNTLGAINLSCWIHCGSYTDTYFYPNGLYSNFTWFINQICNANGTCYAYTITNLTAEGKYFNAYSDTMAYYNYLWNSYGFIYLSTGLYSNYNFRTIIYDMNFSIIEDKINNFDSTTIQQQSFLINSSYTIGNTYLVTKLIYNSTDTVFQSSSFFTVYANNDIPTEFYYFNDTDTEFTIFINENWIIYEQLYELNEISGSSNAPNIKCSLLVYDYQGHEIIAKYGHDETTTYEKYIPKELMTNDGGELIYSFYIDPINFLYDTNSTAVLRCGNAEKRYVLQVKQNRTPSLIFNLINYLFEHPLYIIGFIIILVFIFIVFSVLFRGSGAKRWIRK